MARASYVASARAMALSVSPLAWFCAAQWSDFTPPLTDDPHCPVVLSNKIGPQKECVIRH